MTRYIVTLEIDTEENPNWIIDSIEQVIEYGESLEVIDIVEMEDEEDEWVESIQNQTQTSHRRQSLG